MTSVTSAGILLYREGAEGLELLLVHPGGPFWRNRDLGAWSIPKGETAPGEATEATARRELREELGLAFDGPLSDLGEVRQRAGKIVRGFAGRSDFDAASLKSEPFEMEWPPRSGRLQAFPEVDRAAWFAPADARRKLIPAQAPFVDRLERLLAAG
ncbi:NUDIX domain-containing protein [Hansschlegelia sp. KR7-227]|uniref:NUDIX domain-containing protein n=1 Tax=Hansschlegelia sp. KR7-227 TaxID=3400914 RepID=UPI003C03AF17